MSGEDGGGGRPALRPWPASAAFGPRGLAVGGLEVSDLATRYGTPLLVVDEDDVRARCRAYRDAFGEVWFAIKAFPARWAARTAVEEGLGILVASGGELELALRAGIPASRITMHGNNKSDEEIERAALAGVRMLIVDNVEELDRIDTAARSAGRVQDVLIRVIPAVEAHTHAYVETGVRDTKFGIPMESFLDAVKRADALAGIRPAGVHVHIGSQVLEGEPFLAALDVALDLLADAARASGVALSVLDLGGGLGVTYVDEAPPAVSSLAAAVRERLREGCDARGIPVPDLVVEPGRALVANPVVTLYRVGVIKEIPGVRTYLAVDGGMSDNIRPMLYGSRYTFALANRPGSTETARFTIVGKHCESGDVLGEADLPADVVTGDLLAVAATGAYAYAMASSYNRVGRPAVVGVQAGADRVLLRREDDADLDRLEHPSGPVPEAAPPPGIVVRPARPGDARAFLDLWSGIVSERRFIRTEHAHRSIRRQRRRFRRAWTSDECHVLALDGDRVVATLSASRESHPVNHHVASIGMAVAPAYRGRGIGAALMTEAFRWAAAQGVEKLALSVYPGNAAAIGLYARFGFLEEGRLGGHSKKSYGYEDEIVMGRWVARGEKEAR